MCKLICVCVCMRVCRRPKLIKMLVKLATKVAFASFFCSFGYKHNRYGQRCAAGRLPLHPAPLWPHCAATVHLRCHTVAAATCGTHTVQPLGLFRFRFGCSTFPSVSPSFSLFPAPFLPLSPSLLLLSISFSL